LRGAHPAGHGSARAWLARPDGVPDDPISRPCELYFEIVGRCPLTRLSRDCGIATLRQGAQEARAALRQAQHAPFSFAQGRSATSNSESKSKRSPGYFHAGQQTLGSYLASYIGLLSCLRPENVVAYRLTSFPTGDALAALPIPRPARISTSVASNFSPHIRVAHNCYNCLTPFRSLC